MYITLFRLLLLMSELPDVPSTPSTDKKRKRDTAEHKVQDSVSGWRLTNLLDRSEVLHYSKIALDVKKEHGQVFPVVLF